MSERVWNVGVFFTEEPERTRADAVLEIGGVRVHGWGRARRNPTDPDVPVIGEELAAARALSDLAHRLVERAADAIESREGAPPHLHL